MKHAMKPDGTHTQNKTATNKKVKDRLGLLLILGLSLLGLLLAPLGGMEWLPLSAYWDESNPLDHKILWNLRAPRALSAFVAGAGLSLGGMAFQALFRNPLATPYTLGVASGASLGAALYIHLGLSFSLLLIPGISLLALLGALATAFLVYLLTSLKRGFSSAVLLLAGVAINLFLSSLILFIQYFSDVHETFRIIRWMMGGISATGFHESWQMAQLVLPGLLLLIYHYRELDLLLGGEELAHSRGVDLERAKKMIFLSTSLILGGVVAFSGPIGFVGMMAPHMMRLIFGPGHRLLAPASLLFGGLFLVLADLVSRLLIAPAEMPVGIVTSLLGGPFFLWLLLGRKSRLNQGL